MSIIKEAFVEGRTTKVKWDDSKAKERELKMEVFLDNMYAQDSIRARKEKKIVSCLKHYRS